MENVNFIEKLTEYSAAEDVLSVGRDVNELRTSLEDYVLEEERKIQVAEIVAKDNNEELADDVKARSEEITRLKNDFYDLYTVFKTKRKEILEEKNKVEEENLSAKRALIKKLGEVVTSEENIGAAFGSLKEIQEKWKTIGDIPRDKRSAIQADYSKLLEDFFYNIKIYKDLKDHDFNRNYQLKMELIESLKGLNDLKTIKDAESQLKKIQNDWNDIGPVPNEKWEEVKEAYWTEVKSVYNKVNRFYDDRRVQLQENLEKKKILLAETKELIAGVAEVKVQGDWAAMTKSLLELQAKWKSIGFGPKKENEEIWKEFRAECDTFFDAKKAFFEVIQSDYDKIAEKKKAIIEKAQQLQTSTDWKETANKIKNLQRQWKEAGHAGKQAEQKLWKVFRTVCDGFFNARQGHFDAKDEANESNLKAKLELIEAIKAYKLPSDKKEALDALAKFSAEFSEIGHVPMKSKDSIFTGYKTALDEKYAGLNLEGEEKDRILLELKIATLKSSPNASRLLDDLKMNLRKDIDKEMKEITLLENNLGFFANSKGADALKKDVELKVAIAQKKIAGIKKHLKLIPNE